MALIAITLFLKFGRDVLTGRGHVDRRTLKRIEEINARVEAVEGSGHEVQQLNDRVEFLERLLERPRPDHALPSRPQPPPE
jgi:hypothetical protein